VLLIILVVLFAIVKIMTDGDDKYSASSNQTQIDLPNATLKVDKI